MKRFALAAASDRGLGGQGRATTKRPVTRLLRQMFTWSIVGVVVPIVAIIVLANFASVQESVLPLLLSFLCIASGITWSVTLGMIASRLGRSWVVWVGLSMITSPVGFVLASALMTGHIETARNPESPRTEGER